MIRDLNGVQSDGTYRDTDVCIVGAGTAGIFLAQSLRKSGLQVVVLESGDATQQTAESVDHRCHQHGIRYRGATAGRSFGLGGTSALWGGQLIPIVRSDMSKRDALGIEAWPVAYDEIRRYASAAKQMLGLPRDDPERDGAHLSERFPAMAEMEGDFRLRLSQWLPFKNRNFSKAFSHTLNADEDLEVWLNANVVDFDTSTNGSDAKVLSVNARAPGGNELRIEPKLVVVCAGALESTRMMLALDEATGGAITRDGAPLGRYFSDHLSITCGRFACKDWRKFNLAVAPVFRRNIMQTPRLELSSTAQERLGLPSAFAHFTFKTDGQTGFDIVRSIIRRRQGEQLPLDFSLGTLLRGVNDIFGMLIWRAAYGRLWLPRTAKLLLQVDIEQLPNPDSRLTLSEDCDGSGRKRLAIDWRITAEDLRAIREVTDRFQRAWQQSSLRHAADFQLTLPSTFDDFDSLYDVYHPTGTLRMGKSAGDSVTSPDLRVWAFDNLYVSSTAVFPSAGSANPGLTHLALTARLADHIKARLSA